MKYKVSDFDALHAAMDAFCDFLRGERVAEESIFDSKLVLSELASNVLQHSDCTAEITGEIVDGKIRLEVNSARRFYPPEKTALPDDDYADHGRGLYIVDKVSESRVTTAAGGIRVVIRTIYNKNK